MRLHDLVLVPQNAVVVEICTWVEPQVDSLLPATYAIGKHIGLQNVGLARRVAKKLEIKLVMGGLGR